jgi:AraC-like DNA-binding protein
MQRWRRLAAHDGPEIFIERTLELAAEHGLPFSREELRAAMRNGRRQWNEQWKAELRRLAADPDLAGGGAMAGGLVLVCGYTTASAFFRDAVEEALRLPFNQAFRRQTPLSVLTEWQAQSPGLAPSAFILHACVAVRH